MKYAKVFLTAALLALFLPVPAISQDRVLILAPDEFVDELQPLKRFKDFSGRPTTLLSLTQIYSNALFNGVDEPEEIKKCIAYYEKTGVKFVLLVGDVDKFPVRWTWWGRIGYKADGSLDADERHWHPSDLYYADLYNNGTQQFNGKRPVDTGGVWHGC